MTVQEAASAGHTNAIMLYLRTRKARCNAADKSQLITDLTATYPQKYRSLTGSRDLRRAIDALVQAGLLESFNGINTSTNEPLTVLRIKPISGRDC